MLIALLRANSGKPFFQYRFNFWQKITLSKNSAIIRCYSEVMTSPFYLVKLESFTLNVCQLELKKGCQPKLLFEHFGVISNIVRRPCLLIEAFFAYFFAYFLQLQKTYVFIPLVYFELKVEYVCRIFKKARRTLENMASL